MNHSAWWVAGLLALPACNGKDDTADTSEGLNGPSMVHVEFEDSFASGSEITFSVDADDEDGVGGLAIFFRTQDAEYWNNRPMEGQAGVAEWTMVLSGEEVGAPGLEYYFRAEDMGLVTASSYLPLSGADDPFSLTVVDAGLPLPFVEDFEADSLFSLGWVNVWHEFGGYPWRITDVHSESGEHSVVHQRGLEDGSEMDDWLLTPPLDFSGTDAIQVGWQEYGSSISDLTASLWISTGDRDPAEGDYEQVAELSPTSGAEWERAPVVDLSAWGGEPKVFLAWRYQGTHAGDWYLDDVQVQDLSCDLSLALAWPEGTLAPGDTVPVTATLSNRIGVPCGTLDVALSLPDGGATAPAAQPVTSGVETGEDVVFDVVIDTDFPDHSILAIQVDVTGEADAWSIDDEILVGLASEGRLNITTLADGNIQVRLGVGDPEAPDWEEAVHASYELAGTTQLVLDLTDKRESMPPGPGPDRWFARVTSDADAYVELFEIEFAGQATTAMNLPNWYGPGTGLVYAPDPPSPIIVQEVVNPSSASPGTTGISVDLVVYNEGADSDGRVEATFSSSSPHVTVQNPGPVTLADPRWTGNSALQVPTTFLFDVSADHTDSTAVDLSLDVVEYDSAGTAVIGSWSLPVSVEVPWPVLKAVAIVVDDSGGDGDGLLEPGESGEIEVDLRNIGGLATFGTVSGSLVVGAGSTGVVSTSGDSDLLGTLPVGVTRTGSFDVSLDASATTGDVLDLSLDLTDGTQDYTVALELVVGERPWISFSATDDAVGDHYGYDFDVLNGFYRTDGTTLEIMVESAEDFDLSTAFLEAWMPTSGGAYDYVRMVLSGGIAQLQGYQGGFISLPAPTVESVDSRRVKISWPVSDMQLAGTSLRVGLGSGWCGVDTGSFCDHFPDRWGYYYHATYDSTDFFVLDW